MQLALDHLINHIKFGLVCLGMILLPQVDGIYVVVLVSHGGKQRACYACDCEYVSVYKHFNLRLISLFFALSLLALCRTQLDLVLALV